MTEETANHRARIICLEDSPWISLVGLPGRFWTMNLVFSSISITQGPKSPLASHSVHQDSGILPRGKDWSVTHEFYTMEGILVCEQDLWNPSWYNWCAVGSWLKCILLVGPNLCMGVVPSYGVSMTFSISNIPYDIPHFKYALLWFPQGHPLISSRNFNIHLRKPDPHNCRLSTFVSLQVTQPKCVPDC